MLAENYRITWSARRRTLDPLLPMGQQWQALLGSETDEARGKANVKVQRGCGPENFRHHPRRDRIPGIEQDENSPERRDDFLEQLYLLGRHVQVRHKTGQVSAWMRQALHQPLGHWVGHVDKNNGNPRGRRLRRSSRLILKRHDQRDAVADEFRGRDTGRFLIRACGLPLLARARPP